MSLYVLSNYANIAHTPWLFLSHLKGYLNEKFRDYELRRTERDLDSKSKHKIRKFHDKIKSHNIILKEEHETDCINKEIK